MRMLQRADLWGGIFWLIVGVFVTWQGYLLGLGRLSNPGSGFALFWIGLMILGFAATILAGAIRHQGATLSSLWRGARWQRVLAVIAMLVIYGAVFEWAGFVLATAVLLLALMLFVDPVRWPIAVLLSIAAPFGIWALITKWLKIQIPTGLLAPWLG